LAALKIGLVRSYKKSSISASRIKDTPSAFDFTGFKMVKKMNKQRLIIKKYLFFLPIFCLVKNNYKDRF